MNIIQRIFRKVHRKVTKKSKTKDTSLELLYEQHLKQQHIRYKKQYKIDRMHVDFYIPGQNLVVEINGCYAHCCQYCGFNDASYGIPADEKRMRDKRRYYVIKSKGYHLAVIWQHELFGRKTEKGAF